MKDALACVFPDRVVTGGGELKFAVGRRNRLPHPTVQQCQGATVGRRKRLPHLHWENVRNARAGLNSRCKLKLAPLLLAAASLGAAPAADVDAIFAPLVGGKSPGMAVLVRHDGRAVFERGYGVRDLRTMARIDAHTDFRLASFTKQFTAMAVMLLVHDGKLRYDEPLTEIFPDFPAYGRAITVRQLLTHTAGFADYEDLMGETKWTPTHQIQDEEVLALLKQASPKFAPGTSWAYSNSAYVILGLAVAKVSGEPFGEFLRRRIFEPLHMRDTLAYVNGKNTVPNRAYGHTKEGAPFVEADQSSTSATLGDGGVYSNLADLAKWDAALDKHTLLRAEEMQPALTAVKLADGSEPKWPAVPGDDNLNPGKPVAYGFGFFLDPYEGHARMWHTGSTMGFRTVIERFPADKLTVVVLCNRTDLDPAKLALAAAGLFLKKASSGEQSRPANGQRSGARH
jgi:CubicO group peptidase (beta-lactamase class C family)